MVVKLRINPIIGVGGGGGWCTVSVGSAEYLDFFDFFTLQKISH